MKLITIVNTLRRGMQEYTDGNDIFSKVHTFYIYLLNYVFLSVSATKSICLRHPTVAILF